MFLYLKNNFFLKVREKNNNFLWKKNHVPKFLKDRQISHQLKHRTVFFFLKKKPINEYMYLKYFFSFFFQGHKKKISKNNLKVFQKICKKRIKNFFKIKQSPYQIKYLILKKKLHNILQKFLLEKFSLEPRRTKNFTKNRLKFFDLINNNKPELVSFKSFEKSLVNHFFLIKTFKFQSVFYKIDPIFSSFLLKKFINRATLYGKKNIATTIIFSIFLYLKVLTSIGFSSLFFSIVESCKNPLGFLPKNLSGRVHLVPTVSYFDKQFKIALKILAGSIKKKQNIKSTVDIQARSKRLGKLSTFLLRSHKLYFYKHARFTQRKNFLYETLKKNLYLAIVNRTYTQYRWR